MDYEDYCEDYEPTDEFSVKIHELINSEVKTKIKETVEEWNPSKVNTYCSLKS